MNKNNKRNKKKHANLGYFIIDGQDITMEKKKARILRKSSWWREKRSSGICYYCGLKLLPIELTMDHIIPLSRGGKSEKNNIVPACKECNNKKKFLFPMEWNEYIERISNTKNE